MKDLRAFLILACIILGLLQGVVTLAKAYSINYETLERY